MMTEHRLTFDTLVDAYFDAAEHAQADPELRDYHALRREILEALFGCSLEDVPGKPGPLTVEYQDAQTLRWIARSCIEQSARIRGPFGIYLEGSPGPSEAALRKQHEAPLDDAIDALKARLRAIFRDALSRSFPEAESRSFPMETLQQRGLPAERPDPDDFW